MKGTLDKTDMSLSTNQLIEFTAHNLNTLLEKHSISGKRLSEITGCAESTISAIRNKKQFPTMDFLLSLKTHFNISIDEFISAKMNSDHFSSNYTTSELEEKELEDYQKYSGTYFVYYLDTSSPKGDDHKNVHQSLSFGVLHIFENSNSVSFPDFKCIAVFGIKTIDEAKKLKEHLQLITSISTLISDLREKYTGSPDKKIYTGDFSLTKYHAFLSMTDKNKDRLLASFHRVPSSKEDYYGSLGTINSISTGPEPMPVIQFIGISRWQIMLSSEEIYHRLILNVPMIRAQEETKDLIQLFKKCYIPSTEFHAELDDSLKEALISGRLENYIRKSVERNIFRYGKISFAENNDWYHIIKHHSDILNDANFHGKDGVNNV